MAVLVAGVGSPILGDDGVGIHVVRALAERELPSGVELVELGTAGLALADLVAGHDRLIVIDAIVTGAAPGTVHLLDGDAVRSTVHLGQGHEPSLPDALALGRRLLGASMPREVWVVAIEAAELTTFSETLSSGVAESVAGAVERVLELVAMP